jgi:hypothetical protein
MNITKKISLLFCATGFLIIGYSFVIKTYFENLDLGKRFNASEFRESDLYIWIGIIWILLGLIYFIFYKTNKIQLEDKLSKRHFLFTLFFVIELMAIPVLDRYYPTKLYRGTLLMKLLDAYLAVSFVLFFIGKFGFLSNLIKSTYAYLIIKKQWNH